MVDQPCGHLVTIDAVKLPTKHARASNHPVIASAEIGERWLYCYPDDQVVEY